MTKPQLNGQEIARERANAAATCLLQARQALLDSGLKRWDRLPMELDYLYEESRRLLAELRANDA